MQLKHVYSYTDFINNKPDHYQMLQLTINPKFQKSITKQINV